MGTTAKLHDYSTTESRGKGNVKHTAKGKEKFIPLH
jgi:hypothetical protein